MRRSATLFLLVFGGAGLALAHEGRITDLKHLPPEHQVEAVGYCEGKYRVRLKDGTAREFREYDLRLKTDSGPNGPRPASPVLIPAGMTGDRAFLVFSGLEDMQALLKKAC